MGEIVGLRHFATRVEARKFERAALRGLAEDARERKGDLQDELRIVLDSLRVFVACRVNRLDITDILAALIDSVEGADHACNQILDEAGEHFDYIDLSEARALLDGLRP